MTKLVECSILVWIAKMCSPPELGTRLEVLAAACNTVVAAESICLGVAAGLSAKTIIEVISESSGDSHALSHGIYSYLRNAGTAPTLANVMASAKPIITEAVSSKNLTPLVFQMNEIHAAAVRRFGDNADSRMVMDIVVERTKQGDALTMMAESAEGFW
jgi:3-hydroxyisobutyrate dehydrogenase-like beta-hydroxyacid dehydrogenase